MIVKRRRVYLTLFVTLWLVLSSCQSPEAISQPKIKMPTGPGAEWDLIVIGDSTLFGLGKAVAQQIEMDLGVTVNYHPFTAGGLSAGTVLEALLTGKSINANMNKLSEALPDAEMVIMFVNPLDSINPDHPLDLDGCMGWEFAQPKACSPETFEKYTADLAAIWGKIIELRSGQPTVLRAIDIYNPLVSLWVEYEIFDACNICWENTSSAVRKAAEEYNIPFLSRYDTFNGTNHLEDPREKGYIIADGVHPSEKACQYTAGLLSEMGYDPVDFP